MVKFLAGFSSAVDDFLQILKADSKRVLWLLKHPKEDILSKIIRNY
jgi:hypothetical protein